MKQVLLLLALFIASLTYGQTESPQLHAQELRADTVKRGYYIPFGTSYTSCKVVITPKGQKSQFTNTTGNKIPDSLVTQIGKLEVGSVVNYSEVTIINNGVPEKASSVRYVIGSKNTFPNVLHDPSQPDTLAAAEIANMVLDPHVYSFHISFVQDGAYYDFELTGNGVFGEAREKILGLPSGTRVWFENIKMKDDNGSLGNAPAQVHVVK